MINDQKVEGFLAEHRQLYCKGRCHICTVMEALLAEVRQLRAAARQLRIDANRLCDRNLGGSYEQDCRKAITEIDRLL